MMTAPSLTLMAAPAYADRAATLLAAGLGGLFIGGAKAPMTFCRRFFCARSVSSWWLRVGHLRVCRVPFAPVGQPAYSRHHSLLGRKR